MFSALVSVVLGLGLRGDTHLTFPFEQYHHTASTFGLKSGKQVEVCGGKTTF